MGSVDEMLCSYFFNSTNYIIVDLSTIGPVGVGRRREKLCWEKRLSDWLKNRLGRAEETRSEREEGGRGANELFTDSGRNVRVRACFVCVCAFVCA